MPEYTDILTIDPEFAAICPPQSDEEIGLLTESLCAEGGCNTPILYWENDPEGEHPIIDGMTRYRICLDNELNFPTKGMQFADRGEVVHWIRLNQLSRRNISGLARDLVLAGLYEERVKPHGDTSRLVSDSHVVTVTTWENPAENDDCGFFDAEPKRTCEAVAEEVNVSPSTVNRAVKNALALKELRHRAPDVAAAVSKANIGPTAIKSLSVAPEATLEGLAGLAGLAGKELKAAVKEVLHPKPPVTRDLSLFEKLDNCLKAVMSAADEVQRAYPSPEFFDVVRIETHKSQQAAKKWRDEVLKRQP